VWNGAGCGSVAAEIGGESRPGWRRSTRPFVRCAGWVLDSRVAVVRLEPRRTEECPARATAGGILVNDKFKFAFIP
jgi:hypothetical protein